MTKERAEILWAEFQRYRKYRLMHSDDVAERPDRISQWEWWAAGVELGHIKEDAGDKIVHD